MKRIKRNGFQLTLGLLTAISIMTIAGTLGIAQLRADEGLPITFRLDESNGELFDYVDIQFPTSSVVGTHIGIKLNVAHAIDQNGNVPKWNMFHLTLFDEQSNIFSTNQPTIYTTTTPYMLPAFSETGIYTDITWGHNYMWPNIGFFGTVYIPWSLTNVGSVDNPTTAPSSITKIRIQTNAKVTSRQQIITDFFEIIDASLVLPDSNNNWIGDVRLLHDFNNINPASAVTVHKTHFDFSTLDLQSDDFSYSTDAKIYIETMDQTRFDELMASLEDFDYDEAWKSAYVTSGQKFSAAPFENGEYGQGVHWQYGSYLMDYDSSLNAYGSLRVPISTTDWRGALGMTIWVKNEQSYPVSFNYEFQEAEQGGTERWNLNSIYYKRIYAYDMNTGEEFSFNTYYVCHIPANFEGWLRIPFAEYECPAWSLAATYNDGILDLNKPHTAIYLTSQFSINDGVSFKFDNVGIYYSEFQVGKLFDRTLPSISDCLDMEFEVGGR